jgi:hypothetical protein
VQCVGVAGVGGEEVVEDGSGGGRLAGGDLVGGTGEVCGALGGGWRGWGCLGGWLW